MQNAIEAFRAGKAASEEIKKPVKLATTSVEDFVGMDIPALIVKLRAVSKTASSAHVNGGKIISLISQLRDVDDKSSLTGFLTKEMGEKPHDHALMCAVSFDLVGNGHGNVTESEWDTTPLKWHLQISPIFKFMQKEKTPDETVAQVREEIAVIVRTKPTDGEAQLKQLKKLLRGKPETPGANAGGEGDQPENLEVLPVSLLDDATLQLQADQIDACTDLETLDRLAQSFLILSQVCKGRAGVLRDEAPTPAVKMPLAA